MRGELIKWVPATLRHGSFGFVKPEQGSRDIVVFGNHVVQGVPYVGATLEFRTRKSHHGGNNRLEAYDVRIIA